MADSRFDETLDEQAQAQTPKPAAPSRWDQTLDGQAADKQQSVRQATIGAADTTPDRAKQVLELAGQLGLPADVVDKNYDEIAKNAATHRHPFQLVIDQTPALSSFVQQSPTHAALVKDDMENLGALEWFLKAPSR